MKEPGRYVLIMESTSMENYTLKEQFGERGNLHPGHSTILGYFSDTNPEALDLVPDVLEMYKEEEQR